MITIINISWHDMFMWVGRPYPCAISLTTMLIMMIIAMMAMIMIMIQWWWCCHRHNREIPERANLLSMDDLFISNDLRCAGYVIRSDNKRLSRKILFSQLPVGERRVTRRHLRLGDVIKSSLGVRVQNHMSTTVLLESNWLPLLLEEDAIVRVKVITTWFATDSQARGCGVRISLSTV